MDSKNTAYGVLSLVCPCIGIFMLGGIMGILGIVFGALGLRAKQASMRAISGFGLALGILEVIVMAMYVAAF